MVDKADTKAGSGSAAPRDHAQPRRWMVLVISGAALLAALIVSNVALWIALSSTKDDLRSAERTLERFDDDAGSAFGAVSDALEELRARVGDADDLSSRVDDMEFTLDDLEGCVNEFLRGFDAANGGFFMYSFC